MDPAWRKRRFCAAQLSTMFGIAASLALFFLLRGFEHEAAHAEMHAAARERIELLRNRIECSMEVLHSIGALCGAGAEVSRARFRDFTAEALSRHPEIQALSWNPFVPFAGRAALEEQARRDGILDFSFTELSPAGKLMPAAKRPDYVPIFMLEPLRKNRAALGFDLESDPGRGAALLRARDTGLPCATGPLRLVQEAGQQLGFLVLRPVYGETGGTREIRRTRLAGFVSAVFRVGDLLEDTFKGKSYEGDIAIYDEGRRIANFHKPESGIRTGASLDAERLIEPLEIAGMHWDLEFWFARPGMDWEPMAGLLAGLMITALTTGYIIRGARHTAEIESRVRERTVELSSEIAVRRKVENELRKAEQKYRSIFENAIEGIFQTAPDGHYLSANPALARLYGYASPEELVAALGDIERQLYIEPSRRADFVRQVRQQGAVADFESQVWRKDGQTIWISETARTVCTPDGEVLYYEGTVQDITERKRAHEALEIRVRERTADLARVNEALHTEIAERRRAEDAAASASKAKSAFLAHMSHEIRTPLNAILGYAQILQRDGTLQARQREAIETIASSGHHLFELINEVLDLSKIEAGRMDLQNGDFDLTELIRRLESMFRHRCQQKRLRLVVEPPGEGPAWVHGDEGKLRQVLINLMGNAVKFTDAGEVRLRVSAGPERAFRFEVADTGIGMTPEELLESFEPFHQGHGNPQKEGTGLGLAISDRYIQLMGGRLEAASAPGQGARFFFTLGLPEALHTGRAAAHTGGPSLRLPPGRKVNALVVDDVKENRDVLAGMLSGIGCEVLLAESARRAIELVGAERPDIVFMDIWMPGMNGIEATQEILQRLPETRIVAHSASAFDHEQHRYFDAGFGDFFAKPFRYERVCECVANLLQIELEAEGSVSLGGEAPFPGLALPAALISRMRGAAEIHNITELRACIDEAAALDANGPRAAECLRAWANGYEINKIIAVLKETAVS